MSRRKEARTDDSASTTLSKGMSRAIEYQDIVSLAELKGQAVKDAILEAKRRSDAVREAKKLDIPLDEQLFAKEKATHNVTPLEALKRCLSVRSVISTHSSFAERMNDLREADPKTTMLREIGTGTFGSVFEIPGTDIAIKKTLQSSDALEKEFDIARIISFAMNTRAIPLIRRTRGLEGLLTPRVPWYGCSHGIFGELDREGWWTHNGSRFPEGAGGLDKPGPLFMFERAMPLPQMIRESLIKHFFPLDDQEAALKNPENKNCLIRPYLGCRVAELDDDQKRDRLSTLRNFPLYLDELHDLNMNPVLIARDMALAVAGAHWTARVDLLDSEFVIAGRVASGGNLYEAPIKDMESDPDTASGPGTRKQKKRSSDPRSVTGHIPDFRNRATQLWLFDFDKCTRFEMMPVEGQKERIVDIVKGTRANDPYYPKSIPDNKADYDLWVAFSETYIAASRAIIGYELNNQQIPHAPEARHAAMARPALVMNEWQKQEALYLHARDPEGLRRIKALAKKEGWKKLE